MLCTIQLSLYLVFHLQCSSPALCVTHRIAHGRVFSCGIWIEACLLYSYFRAFIHLPQNMCSFFPSEIPKSKYVSTLNKTPRFSKTIERKNEDTQLSNSVESRLDYLWAIKPEWRGNYLMTSSHYMSQQWIAEEIYICSLTYFAVSFSGSHNTWCVCYRDECTYIRLGYVTMSR